MPSTVQTWRTSSNLIRYCTYLLCRAPIQFKSVSTAASDSSPPLDSQSSRALLTSLPAGPALRTGRLGRSGSGHPLSQSPPTCCREQNPGQWYVVISSYLVSSLIMCI